MAGMLIEMDMEVVEELDAGVIIAVMHLVEQILYGLWHMEEMADLKVVAEGVAGRIPHYLVEDMMLEDIADMQMLD